MDDGPQLAHVNTGSLDTTKNKPLNVDESSEFLGYPVMNCEEAWGIELSCRKMIDSGPHLAHVDTGSMHAPKCVPSSSLLGVKRNTSEDLPPSPLKIQHRQQPPQYIQGQHQSPKHVGLQGQQAIQQPPQQRVFQAQKFSEQVQISMHPPASDLMNPLWCELCEVVCSSPDNLKQHQQGKKHKIKQSQPFCTDLAFFCTAVCTQLQSFGCEKKHI
ncbi:hypothetical protein QJS04_geneDACA007928 [Acorus gramineus]|uniref:C2H2-type domain-containing protein n=1 Tax=Acorus gramineus TaxID=55184 RepID=A0AAV9BC98_ACOGR|nr:hypothetical protein QJS04_geneDACA007928 [Acorus gramineus]